MNSAVGGNRVRQTRKSIATRGRVIEAAIACFLDIGYHRTNTSEIAKRAGITRGAVQYYFPTTGDVLTATAEYVTAQILADWESRMTNIPPGADPLDSTIDMLWDVARGPYWTVWRELEAAARTDGELRKLLEPVSTALIHRQVRVAEATFREAREQDPVLFDLCRLMNWFFLRELATAPSGSGGEAGKERLVTALKELMRRVWDVPPGLTSTTAPVTTLSDPARNRH